ncbi:LOW QUALITY PROTEIN: heme-binding protein 2-like [Eucalyptus grandis]|uniref:LOW QUALITY PROTEIN: heme-binding protein 2-like n=1 Tax=Eucalyptus grandis TaxID=71139 RepID=UPI00192EE762|nr:LOW QUALITY PROTEIN: heme-binding protein 2-like [Eucalyptus grandis]
MAATNMLLKLSMFFNILSRPHLGLWSNQKDVKVFPPTCDRIECPSFDVVHVGDGYEIRRYNSTVWIATAPIPGISLVEATRSGFIQLFDYIQGKNSYQKKIEMTAPVITEVSPSDGPFCASSFVVSFYVPKENQANPPPAEGLHAQRWKPRYIAIRQFGGFVADYDVAVEAAALEASLSGTTWANAIEKSREKESGTGTSSYTVAQYNSEFEFNNRVNEIWMPFDLDDASSV